jgi:hypothetical protein
VAAVLGLVTFFTFLSMESSRHRTLLLRTDALHHLHDVAEHGCFVWPINTLMAFIQPEVPITATKNVRFGAQINDKKVCDQEL